MKAKGGVRVLVTLPKTAMAKMKEKMESLAQLQVNNIDSQSKDIKTYSSKYLFIQSNF